ncbi:MAG: right-handed parallel beta-helix repeat-containing protein [Bacteroidetes bacterium]|nr:right-handed parallel beta-helix repeat-containing protein [Bacteroidota bacterium]
MKIVIDYLDVSRIGIHAINIPNLSIGANLNTPVAGTGNTISFSKEKGQYHHGIWVENCNSAKIQSNTIISTEPGFYLEGITVYESTDALINMNTITDATVPVNVRGSCPDTEFHCNVFDNDAESGLGVQLVAADLPPQGDINDPWNNEWYGYDNTTLFGVTGGANSPFNWFYNSGDIKYNPNPASGTANPFGTSAPGSGCMVQAATNDPDRDDRYAAIAEDSLVFTEYENEFTYKSKQYLFEQINADTSLLTKNTSKDTTFSRFYSDILVTNIGSFRRVDSLIMADNLAAALTLNDTIPAANEMEWNLKTVNTLLISKVLVDSALSSTDSSSLESIAMQDPIVAGKAVYMARAILFKEVHDELPGLRTMNQLLEPVISEIKTSSFQILPNPAFDQCEILFEAMEQDFILELRNGVGQVLYHKKLPSNTLKFDLPLKSYKPGFYLVTTISEANGFQFKKLIIAR